MKKRNSIDLELPAGDPVDLSSVDLEPARGSGSYHDLERRLFDSVRLRHRSQPLVVESDGVSLLAELLTKYAPPPRNHASDPDDTPASLWRLSLRRRAVKRPIH
ncbi:hypothetical protein [Neorhizobium vignae]|uniref:hypothetical protein n=1 Tax=Neorhizobium vignae TaxID=690585 RepID=UPI00055F1584|nr:hypothetical protein [Neorhizobium vignae]